MINLLGKISAIHSKSTTQKPSLKCYNLSQGNQQGLKQKVVMLLLFLAFGKTKWLIIYGIEDTEHYYSNFAESVRKQTTSKASVSLPYSVFFSLWSSEIHCFTLLWMHWAIMFHWPGTVWWAEASQAIPVSLYFVLILFKEQSFEESIERLFVRINQEIPDETRRLRGNEDNC